MTEVEVRKASLCGVWKYDGGEYTISGDSPNYIFHEKAQERILESKLQLAGEWHCGQLFAGRRKVGVIRLRAVPNGIESQIKGGGVRQFDPSTFACLQQEQN